MKILMTNIIRITRITRITLRCCFPLGFFFFDNDVDRWKNMRLFFKYFPKRRILVGHWLHLKFSVSIYLFIFIQIKMMDWPKEQIREAKVSNMLSDRIAFTVSSTNNISPIWFQKGKRLLLNDKRPMIMFIHSQIMQKISNSRPNVLLMLRLLSSKLSFWINFLRPKFGHIRTHWVKSAKNQSTYIFFIYFNSLEKSKCNRFPYK